MSPSRTNALVLAAQSLFELERRNHEQGLLFALAAVRAAAPRRSQSGVTPPRAEQLWGLPLLVHRALRRALEATIPVRHLWGHHHDVPQLCWSPDGQQILAQDAMGFLSIWNVATGQLTRQFLLQVDDPVPHLERVELVGGEDVFDWVRRHNASFQHGLQFGQTWLAWHPMVRPSCLARPTASAATIYSLVRWSSIAEASLGHSTSFAGPSLGHPCAHH
jgi:hypothetical protein